jgi:hypothetical protein
VVSKTSLDGSTETPPTLGKGSLGSLEVGHEIVPLVSGGHGIVQPVSGAGDAPGVGHEVVPLVSGGHGIVQPV